jgi:hypothetical protein
VSEHESDVELGDDDSGGVPKIDLPSFAAETEEEPASAEESASQQEKVQQICMRL